MAKQEPISLQDRIRRLDSGPQQEAEAKSSAATQLTDLMLRTTSHVWHTPDKEPFATFRDAKGVVSHIAIYSSDFAELAQRLFYLETKRAIASDAVKSAVNTIAAEAKYNGREELVYSRVAHYEGAVWVDLGDDTWRAVRIDSYGWEVVESSEIPVKFRRSRASRPLPAPVPGGSLADLRQMFCIPDDDWMLLVGWLLGVFQPVGARAHLELLGRQGSGKSTLARYLIAMTDPTSIPGRSLSKDEEALVIAVQNRATLCFDNVSVLAPEMSDAWCRLSTGGGLGKRKLHSDQEEILIQAQLPIMWTSIVPIAASRDDLQDRSVTVRLESLTEDRYRSEQALNDEFGQLLPTLTGAIYTLVSAALRNMDTVELTRRPRLADFAGWVEAAAPALGWEPGAFVDVMQASRYASSSQAVDGSPVGRLLVELSKQEPEWHGQMSELLEKLKGMADDDTRKQKSFPADATRLSRTIRRLEAPLEVMGVGIEFARSRTNRAVTIRRAADASSLEVEPRVADAPRSYPPAGALAQRTREQSAFPHEHVPDGPICGAIGCSQPVDVEGQRCAAHSLLAGGQ
jgi:hypothetical protein